MLLDEPEASVLSVGMAVRFASQRISHLALKESLGMTPAQLRKKPDAVRAPD